MSFAVGDWLNLAKLRLVFHGNHPGNHGLYVTHKAQALRAVPDSGLFFF